MLHTVYQTTNILNDVFYVGKHSTEDVYDNYLGSGLLIQKAIKKYDKENFHKSILFVFDNEQEAFEKEFEIIQENISMKYKTYNIASGGRGGQKGRSPSQETRNKIGEGNKGKTVSEESRKKIGDGNRGKVHSKELNQRVSDTKKANPYIPTKEHKEILSKCHKGVPLLKETCAKISHTLMGHYVSQETIDKARKKNTYRWIITSPTEEVFSFLGQKQLKAFCRERQISVGKLTDLVNQGIIDFKIKKRCNHLAKNTIGWKSERKRGVE